MATWRLWRTAHEIVSTSYSLLPTPTPYFQLPISRTQTLHTHTRLCSFAVVFRGAVCPCPFLSLPSRPPCSVVPRLVCGAYPSVTWGGFPGLVFVGSAGVSGLRLACSGLVRHHRMRWCERWLAMRHVGSASACALVLGCSVGRACRGQGDDFGARCEGARVDRRHARGCTCGPSPPG